MRMRLSRVGVLELVEGETAETMLAAAAPITPRRPVRGGTAAGPGLAPPSALLVGTAVAPPEPAVPARVWMRMGVPLPLPPLLLCARGMACWACSTMSEASDELTTNKADSQIYSHLVR